MIKLSSDNIQSFLTAIRAPVILIRAENSALKPDDKHAAAFEWVPQMQIVRIVGSHHLHLEGQAEQVAEKLQPLFG
jgi:pimeloyl-ACP methyl ester carboxylesterase